MTDYAIEVTGVKKTYSAKGSGSVDALKGVDFSVRVGEFVALRGPSGCGKTTMLLCAGALLSPDGGTVNVNGVNPYSLTNSARSRFRAMNIGFVFQTFQLVPYLSVIDNIMICSLAGCSGDSLKKRAIAMIERLKLEQRIHHLPSELSIGEQQRVALARAVCGGAKIILADEPTGNLDFENGRVVLEYFVEFTADGGSVLMVTHDENVGNYASRHIAMKDGGLDV